jgi:hypothetical protein
MQKSRLGAMVLFSMICHGVHAEQLEPGSPLSGYQCYHLDAEALKLTPDDLWIGKAFLQCLRDHRKTAGNWV